MHICSTLAISSHFTTDLQQLPSSPTIAFIYKVLVPLKIFFCTPSKDWNVKRLTFEIDTEPYAKARDEEISNLAAKRGIEVIRDLLHKQFTRVIYGSKK
jgi:hypothetical protein